MQQPRTLWRWISVSPFLHYRLQSVVHLTLVSGSGCHSGPPTGEQVCLSTPNPTEIPDQVFKTNLSSSTNQLSFDHNKSASSGQHWQSLQGLFCIWSKPSTSRNPGEPSPSYPQTYSSGLLHDQQGQPWVPPGLWSWLCHLWSISRALHVPAILPHPSPFALFLSRRSEATVLSCEPSVVLITGGDQASLLAPSTPPWCCCCRQCSRSRSTPPPPTPAGSPYPPSTDSSRTTPSTMLTAMSSSAGDPPTVCWL